MGKEMTVGRIEQLTDRIDKAMKHIDAIVKGDEKWTVSIPAKVTDSDISLTLTLREAKFKIEALTDENKELKKERDELRRVRSEHIVITRELSSRVAELEKVIEKVRGLAEEWQLVEEPYNANDFVAGETNGVEYCADQLLKLLPAPAGQENEEGD